MMSRIQTRPPVLSSTEVERVQAALQLVDDAHTLEKEETDNYSQIKEMYLSALSEYETLVGYISEGSARIYYRLAWLSYDRKQNVTALSFFLQSLRIVHCLYQDGEHPSVLLLMDDIDDVLEDLGLEEDYVNNIFDAWALQDEANEKKTKHADAVKLFARSIELFPEEMAMERAMAMFQLGCLMEREKRTQEQALRYFGESVRLLQEHLTPDHPRILLIQKKAHQILTSRVPAATSMASSKRRARINQSASCRRQKPLLVRRQSSITQASE